MDTEKQIVDFISEKTRKPYKSEYVLRNLKGEELGYVDYAWEVNDNTLVLLEYEKEQKHPCTNVLKVWPYLEASPKIKVLLIQIFENKKISSRVKLSHFVGHKIEEQLPANFRYTYYLLSDCAIDGLKEQVLLSIEQFSLQNSAR